MFHWPSVKKSIPTLLLQLTVGRTIVVEDLRPCHDNSPNRYSFLISPLDKGRCGKKERFTMETQNLQLRIPVHYPHAFGHPPGTDRKIIVDLDKQRSRVILNQKPVHDRSRSTEPSLVQDHGSHGDEGQLPQQKLSRAIRRAVVVNHQPTYLVPL